MWANCVRIPKEVMQSYFWGRKKKLFFDLSELAFGPVGILKVLLCCDKLK